MTSKYSKRLAFGLSTALVVLAPLAGFAQVNGPVNAGRTKIEGASGAPAGTSGLPSGSTLGTGVPADVETQPKPTESAPAVVAVQPAPAAAQPAVLARPGHEPGVGPSEPSSGAASNIDRADTRSPIAPRLPGSQTPAQEETAEQFLTVAHAALAARQTGRAQEALERAETRMLDRSTRPADAGNPSDDPRIAQIGQARQALARGDLTAARQAVDLALASGG